jgi:hypothetical protein
VCGENSAVVALGRFVQFDTVVFDRSGLDMLKNALPAIGNNLDWLLTVQTMVVVLRVDLQLLVALTPATGDRLSFIEITGISIDPPA